MKNKIKNILLSLIGGIILIIPIVFPMIKHRVNVLRVILIEVMVYIIAYLIRKYVNKKIKVNPTFKEEYYRDIPEIKPAELLYCLNKVNYDIKEDFYATILDLINRNFLELNKGDTLRYKIKINEQKDFSKLNKYENHLIKLLFLDYNRNELEFDELKRNIEEDELFQQRIDAWKMLVELEAKKNEYTIKNKKITVIKKICEILFVICFFINMFLLPFDSNINEIVFITIIGISIVSIQLWLIDETNFNLEIVNEMEKSKALKRFLEEYSLIKEKKFEHVILWEGFLVYATILDTPKNIKKFFDNIFG